MSYNTQHTIIILFGFVRDKDKKPVVDVPTTVCALSKKKASLT